MSLLYEVRLAYWRWRERQAIMNSDLSVSEKVRYLKFAEAARDPKYWR